jgi:hypothetical protein
MMTLVTSVDDPKQRLILGMRPVVTGPRVDDRPAGFQRSGYQRL